jgi:hypothetical protein
MPKATKVNPHTGSSFDQFLKEDGIFEEVQAHALKRALAEQLMDYMQSGKVSKVSKVSMATMPETRDKTAPPSPCQFLTGRLIQLHPVKALEPLFKQQHTQLPLPRPVLHDKSVFAQAVELFFIAGRLLWTILYT